MPARATASTDPHPSLSLSTALWASCNLCSRGSWGRRKAAGVGSISLDTDTVMGTCCPPELQCCWVSSSENQAEDLCGRAVYQRAEHAGHEVYRGCLCFPAPLSTAPCCQLAMVPAIKQLWREQALISPLDWASSQPCPPSWTDSGQLDDLS